MKFKIFTATKHSNISERPIMSSKGITSSDVLYRENNTDSLSKVYNDAIEDALDAGIEYLILVHDDVIINCSDFLERIERGFKEYDILGLAGNTVANLSHDKPILWHLISERWEQLGCVAHGDAESYQYTSFGMLNKRALMIDGLFIGINLKTIGNLRFDDNNPAKFHFYDLIFSIDAALNKKRVGVIDLPVIHSSPGLRSFTEEWKQGEKYFREKYKAYTGKKITL